MWADNMLDVLMPGAPAQGLQCAEMTGPKTCRIGTFPLAAEDLLIDERLLYPACTKVSETAPADGGQCSDHSVYLSALKAGDQVLVYRLSDSKYVILAKLIEAKGAGT